MNTKMLNMKPMCDFFNDHRVYLIGYIVVIAALCGCAGSTNKQPAQQTAIFVLPEIPILLNTPEQRAEYLAMHYWDHFDFADTTLIGNKITESVFADYLSILPHTTPQTAKSSIAAITCKALNGSQAMYDCFAAMFEKYLDDPNSPIRNEELYVLVVECQLEAQGLDELYKIRPRARLDTALKNRKGGKATNFEYLLANGKKHYMHEIVAKYLILFFNNPDCHDCARVKEILAKISDKNVHVLAIYADEEIELWKKSKYPTDWINGYSSSVRADQLYDLRAIPNLYLLDKDKRVILKDVSVEVIIEYLNQNNS